MKIFRYLLFRLFPTYYKLFQNFKTLAILHGQKKSIQQKKPISFNGGPLPWYTYPAIEYLGQFYLRNMTVFEFGSGFSSLFWAKRAKKIVSVEHDKEWLKCVTKNI